MAAAPDYTKEQLEDIIKNAAIIRTDELQLTGLQGSINFIQFLNRYMPYIKGLAICAIMVLAVVIFRLVDNNMRMYLKCDMGETIASNTKNARAAGQTTDHNVRALQRPAQQSCDDACKSAGLECCLLAYRFPDVVVAPGNQLKFDSCSTMGFDTYDFATCICKAV